MAKRSHPVLSDDPTTTHETRRAAVEQTPFPILRSNHATLSETLSVMEEQAWRRRQLLRFLGSAALVGALPARALACSLIPSETGGPYPGDGTNGPNALTQSGIVRSDIRSNFGSAGTTTSTGTPLKVTLRLVSTTSGCASLQGLAVYIWHCDAQGRYSLYSSGVTTQNFLRGVQITDANGEVTFTTIFPGCYSGRWPHIHFEVYANAAAATTGSNAIRTSQMAMSAARCTDVFAQTALYPGSQSNFSQTSLATDNVFSDDQAVLQLPAITGDTANGYVATLEVGVAVTPTATSVVDIGQFGLTGAWYEPASSGQGFLLGVLPDTAQIFGGWFTFDSAPAGGVEKLRWYSVQGTFTPGTSAATLGIYRNTGGNFVVPPKTTAQQVGSMSLTFNSCTNASASYAFSDGSGRSGSIALNRLTQNVTCSLTSARPTQADFALSGAWYDPTTSGQGLLFEINPLNGATMLAWYTYAVNGQALGVSGQRWYTAQGAMTTGQRAFDLTLYETTGGIFDTATAVSQTTTPVGTGRLVFSSCTQASLQYSFTGGGNAGSSGSIALTRIGPSGPGCVA